MTETVTLEEMLENALPAQALLNAIESTAPVRGLTLIVRGEKGIALLGNDDVVAEAVGNYITGSLETEPEDQMEEHTISFDDIEHETESAVMFEFDSRLVWLPKSQVTYDRNDKTVTVPQWLVEEHGLEDLVDE